MKLITLFALAVSVLMLAPTASAYDPDFDFAFAAPCGSITGMGVVPYTLCMGAWAAGVGSGAYVTACNLIFGPGTC